MKIYEFNTYQEVIKCYVSEQEILDNKLTYQEISSQLRMQKSYFSKIMGGNANLNKDQAYLLSKLMNLNTEEREFLFLLVDYARAGLKDLKKDLKAKIKELQIQNTQSHKYLDKETPTLSSTQMQEYYLLPEIQLIHLACGIKSYQRNPELIKEDLKVSSEVFSQALKILESLNLIKIENNHIKLLKSNLHLDHNSPFFHSWQTQFKLKGIEWTKGLETKDKYNFIASFSANDDDKEKIRVEFLNFLKKVEKIVKKSDAKNLYQFNFDLFKWI